MIAPSIPQVVIVGGGFAGLYAARALRDAPVQVTLLDRRNYHLFQPLLYQVATAALDPSDIAAPLRTVLRDSANTQVLLAEVEAIDVANRKLKLDEGELAYDQLIVAAGAHDSYFGHETWADCAPGLKTLENALEVRRRVFFAFEEAERLTDPEARKAWMTFVLIGGGPTGVEMAGALAEISRKALKKDFHRINPADARIILVEGHPKLLPFYPDTLTDDARRTLERLGVEVRTGQRVTAIEPDAVVIGDERVATHTAVWSAGVAASPLGKSLGAPLDKAGRVKVTPFLTVPGHDEIFVVGDLAFVEQGGKLIPGVAPAAIQMGKHAARNVVHKVRGEPLAPFQFRDKGTFAVIGRGAAVGLPFGRYPMKGFFAWAAWLLIHLFFLVGFRNRVFVMLKWAYAYATMRRYARLITGPFRRRAPKAA